MHVRDGGTRDGGGWGGGKRVSSVGVVGVGGVWRKARARATGEGKEWIMME